MQEVLVSSGADVDLARKSVALHFGRHHGGFSHHHEPRQTTVDDATHQRPRVDTNAKL